MGDLITYILVGGIGGAVLGVLIRRRLGRLAFALLLLALTLAAIFFFFYAGTQEGLAGFAYVAVAMAFATAWLGACLAGTANAIFGRDL